MHARYTRASIPDPRYSCCHDLCLFVRFNTNNCQAHGWRCPGSSSQAGRRQGGKQPPTQNAPPGHNSSSRSCRARDRATSQLQSPTSTLQPPVASYLSDLVELNVGGTPFTTTRATLEESQPQGMLAALVISGRHGPPRHDAKVRGEETEVGQVG